MNGTDSQIFIITGLSGSGLSSATNAFEDLNYFCVDNLPVTLMPTFARLILPDEEGQGKIERAALAINIRGGKFLSEFAHELQTLREQGLQVFVMFFEASDTVLQRRFSETRRPHPADKGCGLVAAIAAERAAMEPLRHLADLIVDTSEHTVHTLRHWLIEHFGPQQGTGMRVQLLSFGHKYGSPRDIDLMFDVRHLPNPYFEAHLRDFSGNDRKIVEYLRSKPEVVETERRFYELLTYLLPLYQREGKSYLTVGIGCTGGRHRSVMMANALARALSQNGFDAHSLHRDVDKAKPQNTRSRKAT